MRYSRHIITATLAVAAGRVGAKLQTLPGEATETAPALEATTTSLVESTSAVIATGEVWDPRQVGFSAETTAEETEAATEYPELVLETTSSAAVATETPAVETATSSAAEAIPTLSQTTELAPSPALTTSSDAEILTSSSIAEIVGVPSSSSSAAVAISGTKGVPTIITAPGTTATAAPVANNGTAVLTSLDSTGSAAAVVTASASVPGGFLRGSGGGANLSDGEAPKTKALSSGMPLSPTGSGANSNNRNGTATAPFPVPSGAARATGSPLRLDSSFLPSGMLTSVLLTASPSGFGSGRFGGGSGGFGGAGVSAAAAPTPTAPGEGAAVASQSPISPANDSGAGLAAGMPSLALVVTVGGFSWLSWFLLV
ncbi:hypothetical protein DL771_004336 [Monosporascus sp. 5C6A]|nr:hypothetical protein DL771_004336 [Monosporascus sp. 5C6A]